MLSKPVSNKLLLVGDGRQKVAGVVGSQRLTGFYRLETAAGSGWNGWKLLLSNQEIPVTDCFPTKFMTFQPLTPTTKPPSTTTFQPNQPFLGISPI